MERMEDEDGGEGGERLGVKEVMVEEDGMKAGGGQSNVNKYGNLQLQLPGAFLREELQLGRLRTKRHQNRNRIRDGIGNEIGNAVN